MTSGCAFNSHINAVLKRGITNKPDEKKIIIIKTIRLFTMFSAYSSLSPVDNHAMGVDDRKMRCAV